MNKHIFLIGMRGSGKTFIAQKLAKVLNIPVIDTDKYIQDKEQTSISNIVETKGWDYFRQQENIALKEIVKLNPHIIATGGGLPIQGMNQNILKQYGIIIWIFSPIKLMLERVNKGKNEHRPALTKQNINEEFLKIYTERQPIYAKLANYKFNNHYVGLKSEIAKLENWLKYTILNK